MNKKIEKILFWIAIFFVIMIISGIGGCFYSMQRDPWVDWDEHDPRLHGQEVIFNEPMVYFSIDPLVLYGTDDVPDHDLLFTRKDAMNDYKDNFSLKAKKVSPRTRFTITKSFWRRKNWWEAAFSGHTHDVVLENENGKEVISDFYNFTYSNRPELFDLQDNGYYKGQN